ncbi:MAG TPA: radical SAM protein [Elusimicrobiota bacterium]|nr:radical SAM protein [Elusimicrobiota bacterium]
MTPARPAPFSAPSGLSPRDLALRHEKQAREHYLKGDYPSTVEDLKRCLETAVVPEHKDLRMRLLILQSLRRFGKQDEAWAVLREMEGRYGESGEKYIRNLLLNEKEIQEGRIKIESYPTRLTVRPTSRCSVHCIMCTFWKETPWDMPQKTLDEVADLYPYLEDILWQGGEPFEMDREILERILLRGRDYPRMLQNFITNGQHIDERWAKILVSMNVHMKISIDGTTAEVYEKIRVKSSFEKILTSIQNLNGEMTRQNRRIGFWIHMVVQRLNYHQITDMIEFAHQYGFDGVALSPMEGDLYRKIDVFNYGDPEIWRSIEEQRARARQMCLDYGIYLEDNMPPPPSLEDKPHPISEEESEKRFSLYPMPFEDGARYVSKEYSYFCLSPWKNMILRNGGGVLPNWHCGERYIGSIHESSLLEIWNGEPMQNVRRGIVERRFGGVCRHFCLSGALMETWKHHMEWYWS